MTTKLRGAERVQLLTWRRDQLAAAGFPSRLAAQIARQPGYDIHALIELVERGCPADVAVRILAPLGPGEAA